MRSFLLPVVLSLTAVSLAPSFAATGVEQQVYAREEQTSWEFARGRLTVNYYATSSVVVRDDPAASVNYYCLRISVIEAPWDATDREVTISWGDSAPYRTHFWGSPTFCHDYAPQLGPYAISVEVIVHKDGCTTYWCGYDSYFDDNYPVVAPPLGPDPVASSVAWTNSAISGYCHLTADSVNRYVGYQVIWWGELVRSSCKGVRVDDPCSPIPDLVYLYKRNCYTITGDPTHPMDWPLYLVPWG